MTRMDRTIAAAALAAAAMAVAWPAGADDKAATLVKPVAPAAAASVVTLANTNRKFSAEALRVRADKGDPRAQYLVGHMYDHGTGVKRDHRLALGWFERAARGRVAAAHYKLGLIQLSGELGAPNIVEAYARFRIAARGGDGRAQAMLFYIGPRMNAAELKKAEGRVQDLLAVEGPAAASAKTSAKAAAKADARK